METEVGDEDIVLVLTLKKATNLMAADYGGTSDPYVIFTLGEQRQGSSKKVTTLNPIWEPEETFRFKIDDIEEPVIVSVYDSDLVGDDDSLGDALIHLPRYVNAGRTETALRLINPLNGKPECGTVTLEIFVANKMQAFAERHDDVYEYERFDPTAGAWRPSFLLTDPNGGQCHWSTATGNEKDLRWSPVMNDLVDRVPDHWVIASNWGYMMSGGDADGWRYAINFNTDVWYDGQTAASFVRRRRWRRVLRKEGC
mmetsp:Transcript_42669/g.133763  ORF Transcript_42669/g.133763 Transcript_42669/m.133763 type:complete len:255 (-) Transcript_42669:317-1081(-)